MPLFKHVFHLLCNIERILYHNIVSETKYPSKELRANGYFLCYPEVLFVNYFSVYIFSELINDGMMIAIRRHYSQ